MITWVEADEMDVHYCFRCKACGHTDFTNDYSELAALMDRHRAVDAVAQMGIELDAP